MSNVSLKSVFSYGGILHIYFCDKGIQAQRKFLTKWKTIFTHDECYSND